MRTPLRRRRRAGLPLACTLTVLALLVPGQVSPAAGTATPQQRGGARVLPQGWYLDAGARRLVWHPEERVRTTDARVTVSLEGEDLPTTVPPGGTRVIARLSRAQLSRLQGLMASPQSGSGISPVAVTASGRRLDPQDPSGTADPQRGKATKTTKKKTTAPTPTASPTPTPTTPSRVLSGADDPGRSGTWATRSGEYDLEGLRIDGLAQLVEMRALVVTPVLDAASAAVQRPFALFLHGRHESCYASSISSTVVTSTDASDAWPCPPGWQPVPSHRGYLAYQQVLASQGWITVSVSADGINAQDWNADDGGAAARSRLVRAHLAAWAAWTASDTAWAGAPSVVRAGPRPDLSRVLLVGHSRGGEGVNRAAIDSAVPADGVAVPWRVRGLVLIAPTAFGRDPAPGVPVVVLLPACDGDISDLQGQSYLDDARDAGADPALRTAVLVAGANHNAFNTEWTPGRSTAPSVDDADSGTATTCSPGAAGRLAAETQLQVGVTYTGAAARALVGQEQTALALLDDSGTAAASTASVAITEQSLGGGRTPLLVPGPSVSPAGSLTAKPCRINTTDETDEAPCRPYDDTVVAPSFWPASVPGQPSRWASRLAWTSAPATVDLPLTATTLGSASAVALRLVTSAGAPAQPFAASLVDTAGRVLALPSFTLSGLPRMSAQRSWLMPDRDVTQEVRLAVDRTAAASAGVDLQHLAALRLTAGAAPGKLWLLDAWAVPALAASGSAATTAFTLPRLDVIGNAVPEGDDPHDVLVPVRLRGPVTAGASAWFLVTDPDDTSSLVGPVSLPPGVTTTTIRVPVPGNVLDDVDERDLLVQASAVRGVVVGDFAGRITLTDDDDSPAITVTSEASATEKGTLTWTFALDGPTGAPLSLPVTVLPPPSGSAELTVADLDAKWVKRMRLDPRDGRPLSTAGLRATVALSTDAPTATFSIKLAPDSVTEGREVVVLAVGGDTSGHRVASDGTWVRGLPEGARLTGTVTDAG